MQASRCGENGRTSEAANTKSIKEKSMKKKKYSLLAILSLLLVFVLGGCQKAATPEGLLEEMAEKTAKMDSCSINMLMDMKISASVEGLDMDMGLLMDMDTDITSDPVRMHGNGKFSVSMLGQDMDMDMEMYSLQEDGKNLSYVKIYDNWIKQEAQDMSSALEAYTFKDFRKMSQSLELDEKTQSENDKECYVLSGNISGSSIKGVLDTVLGSMDSSGIELDTNAFADTRLDYQLFIDKKDKYPVKMTMDMKNLMEAAMNASQDEVNFTCESCDFTYNFTAFNTVESIELPAEARDSATDMEDFTEGLPEGTEDIPDPSEELSSTPDEL